MVYSQVYMIVLGLIILIIDRTVPRPENKGALPLVVWGFALILVGIGVPLVSEKVVVPLSISVAASILAPFTKGKLQLILNLISTLVFCFLIFKFFQTMS